MLEVERRKRRKESEKVSPKGRSSGTSHLKARQGKGKPMDFNAKEFMTAFRSALDQDHAFRCELARCLADNALSVLPVEPLFDLPVSCALIPMEYNSLRSFLYRHKAEFPPRYKLVGSGHRRMRMLYAKEVIQIRQHVFRGYL